MDPTGGRLTPPAVSDIAQLLPEAVIAVDTAGCLKWANDATERLFGKKIDEWLGQSTLSFVHPDDVELVANSLVSIQNKEVGTYIELRVRATEGWRLMEVVGSNLLDHPGVEAIVLCLRDLTERRRWEVASDEVSRFRSLVHYADTIVMLLDPEGHVESTSAAITRLLGHDQELVEGRPFTDFVDPADRQRLTADLARNASGATSSMTLQVGMLRRQGGDPVPFELHIVNLLEDPTVRGLVVSGHDITELRASMEKLAEAQSELSRKERLASVGQLASTIGHELRNPLTAVTNAHFLIRQLLGPPLPEPVERQLTMAEREISRAVNLAGDLMSYVRPRRGQLASLDARGVVSEVLEATPPQAGVSLSLTLDDVSITADEENVRQMLINLLTNAYQAVPDGGTVKVSLTADADQVVIAVEDDGPGIDPDVAAHLFEPFVTTKAHGTGLGLAIALRLAEEHGGTLTLANRAAGGARAELRLARVGSPPDP